VSSAAVLACGPFRRSGSDAASTPPCRIDNAKAKANAKIANAQNTIDNIQATYNGHNADCSWRRPVQCAEAAADWIALKAAEGVMDAAQAVANAVLK
jgi:roadblock/LC7 domain-containing protein